MNKLTLALLGLVLVLGYAAAADCGGNGVQQRSFMRDGNITKGLAPHNWNGTVYPWNNVTRDGRSNGFKHGFGNVTKGNCTMPMLDRTNSTRKDWNMTLKHQPKMSGGRRNTSLITAMQQWVTSMQHHVFSVIHPWNNTMGKPGMGARPIRNKTSRT